MPNRRNLLKGMGGIALAAATPSVVEATQMRQQVVLTKSYVVNLSDSVLLEQEGPSVGDRLALVREPERAFDPNSIGVYFGDQRLGYLPGNQSKLLAPMLDAGFELEANVTGAKRLPRPTVDLEHLVLRS